MNTSINDVWRNWPRAVAVHADAERLRVELTDGREISLPFTWFDFLAGATDKQRQDFRILERGAGIWWEEIDEGVSVPGLLGLPEYPPPDPDVRSYVVDYRAGDQGWDGDIRGTTFSTSGRSLAVTKRRARELLRGYLNVPDLDEAEIEVVDNVQTPEPARA
jgi:hypothetical protein